MRLLVIHCIAASFIWTWGLASANADGNTGMVRGFVRTANTNEPVCGVRVYASSNTERIWSTVTNEQGFFVFLALFPGIAHVSAELPRGPLERNVQVSANLLSEVTLYVAGSKGRYDCRARHIASRLTPTTSLLDRWRLYVVRERFQPWAVDRLHAPPIQLKGVRVLQAE